MKDSSWVNIFGAHNKAWMKLVYDAVCKRFTGIKFKLSEEIPDFWYLRCKDGPLTEIIDNYASAYWQALEDTLDRD